MVTEPIKPDISADIPDTLAQEKLIEKIYKHILKTDRTPEREEVEKRKRNLGTKISKCPPFPLEIPILTDFKSFHEGDYTIWLPDAPRQTGNNRLGRARRDYPGRVVQFYLDNGHSIERFSLCPESDLTPSPDAPQQVHNASGMFDTNLSPSDTGMQWYYLGDAHYGTFLYDVYATHIESPGTRRLKTVKNNSVEYTPQAQRNARVDALLGARQSTLTDTGSKIPTDWTFTQCTLSEPYEQYMNNQFYTGTAVHNDGIIVFEFGPNSDRTGYRYTFKFTDEVSANLTSLNDTWTSPLSGEELHDVLIDATTLLRNNP